MPAFCRQVSSLSYLYRKFSWGTFKYLPVFGNKARYLIPLNIAFLLIQFIHQNPPISSQNLPFSHKKHFCFQPTQLSSFFTMPFTKHTISPQNPIISLQNPSISPQNRFLHNFSNIYIQITFCLFHVLYFSYDIYNLITFVLCHFWHNQFFIMS